jgi:hypothetical protein
LCSSGVGVGVTVGVGEGVGEAVGDVEIPVDPGHGILAGYWAIKTTHATDVPPVSRKTPTPTHFAGKDCDGVVMWRPLPEYVSPCSASAGPISSGKLPESANTASPLP